MCSPCGIAFHDSILILVTGCKRVLYTLIEPSAVQLANTNSLLLTFSLELLVLMSKYDEVVKCAIFT